MSRRKGAAPVARPATGGRAAPRRGSETEAERRARAVAIARELRRCLRPTTALAFETPFQLLIATILSAQCTDRKVNEVTARLWKRYPTVAALAGAALSDLEEEVRPTGYFRQKAKAIRSCAEAIVRRYGGEVPASLDDLVTLPGVGRKTANVVLGNAFGIPGVIVDTHVIRVAGRLRLTDSGNPERIEQDLMAVLPEKEWTPFSNLLVLHGREVCRARGPRCSVCAIAEHCPSAGKVEGSP